MKAKATYLLFLLVTWPLFSATHTVRMSGNRFVPANLTVQAGDIVTWVNDDFSRHDTVSGTGGVPSGTWRSELLPRGGTFSFTFNIPQGNYPYYCTPHVGIGMVGSITVAAPPNPPPTVRITSPAAGSVFFTSANFAIEATATDSDGVASVQFFRGVTSLGTVTSPPYRVETSIAQAGTYTLRAVARDTRGGAATNSILITVRETQNTPPTISITTPANQSRFVAPADFVFATQPSDAEGISNVEFFLDGGSLGTTNVAPYSIPISIPVPGIYSLSAIVTDTAGATASASVQVVVEEPTAGTLLVSLINPTNGQEFVFPATVPIVAFATNELTRIVQVQFFVDEVLLATDLTFPFESEAGALELGEHTIQAIALDARGQIASNSVRIIVIEPINILPTLELRILDTGPFTAGQTISIDALPSDADGLVTNLIFLANSDEPVIRASSIQERFRVTLAQGTNFIQIIATDNRGGTATNELQIVAGVPGIEFDVLFKDESGRTASWRISGTNLLSTILINDGQPVAAGWRLVTRGDLDKDGNPELLWQNEDGTLATWHMHGGSLLRAQLLDALPPFGRAWRAISLADLDGDTDLDILWRHDLGFVAIYFMDGIFFVDGDLISDQTVPADWQFVSALDINNDRTFDIVWRLPDGTLRAWVISNGRLSYSTTVTLPASVLATYTAADGSETYAGLTSARILQIVRPDGSSFSAGTTVPSGWTPIAITPSLISTAAPNLEILSPGPTTDLGSNIVAATATDPVGSIIDVRFWLESSSETNFLGIAQKNGNTYQQTGFFSSPGVYRIRAVALNSSGVSTTKTFQTTVVPPASITVGSLSSSQTTLLVSKVSRGAVYEIRESTDLRNWTNIVRTFTAEESTHELLIPRGSGTNRFFHIRRRP